jgi:hypothetical protein
MAISSAAGRNGGPKQLQSAAWRLQSSLAGIGNRERRETRKDEALSDCGMRATIYTSSIAKCQKIQLIAC